MEFKNGSIVYLQTGQKATYMSECKYGHIVSVTDDFEEDYDSDLGPSIEAIDITIFVPIVFENFPTKKAA